MATPNRATRRPARPAAATDAAGSDVLASDDLDLLSHHLATGSRAALTVFLARNLTPAWQLAAVVTMDVGEASATVESVWTMLLAGAAESSATWSDPRAWLLDLVRRQGLGRATGSASPFDSTGDLGAIVRAFSGFGEVARTTIWLHTVEGLDEIDLALLLGVQRLQATTLTTSAIDDLRTAVRAEATAAVVSARLGDPGPVLAERILAPPAPLIARWHDLVGDEASPARPPR